jgi:hypothetical protein
MKRLMLLCTFIFIVDAAAHAQGRGFGLGVIMGEPTGLSAKGWVSPRGALDAGLAWSFRRDGFLLAHADYLWHFHDVVNTEQRVIPYIGIGGRFGAKDGESIAGIRIAGGLSWWPEGVPIDVFLEIAPVLDLTPATEMSANGGIGVRFFFH